MLAFSAASARSADGKVFTTDRTESASARLGAKMNGLSPGLDSETAYDLTMLAGFHVEAGARRFTEFAKKMIEDLGDSVRPHLKYAYNQVREWPGIDIRGLSDHAEMEAEFIRLMAEHAEQSTPLFRQDIQRLYEVDSGSQSEVSRSTDLSEPKSVWELLPRFGFRPKRTIHFGISLCRKFENFELEAAIAVDKYSRPQVFFHGQVERTERSMFAPIEFWFPTNVISSEQCAALLAYYLRHYPIPTPPWWLVEGRHRADLLPWAIERAARQAAYDALPKCSVQREPH